MNANELRFGNYLKRRSKEDILVVNIKLLTIISRMPMLFKPILLTEEWLLKFGASARFERTEFIYNRYRLIWKEAYKYWYVIDSESLSYLTKIEFVHEWQNFVFVMDSKELIIKKSV